MRRGPELARLDRAILGILESAPQPALSHPGPQFGLARTSASAVAAVGILPVLVAMAWFFRARFSSGTGASPQLTELTAVLAPEGADGSADELTPAVFIVDGLDPETLNEDAPVASPLHSSEAHAKSAHVEAAPVKQNAIGEFADAASGAVFSVLHANDQLGIKDSSKNLRVLWSRALLDRAGHIEDPIAYDLLPEGTRGVIHSLPTNGPLVDFQEFITSRTAWIDGAVESFLRAEVVQELPDSVRPQVVLLGAGYDTRSLRFRNSADFFEVDLPEVVEGKGRLQRRWREQKGEDFELPTRIGFDLNNARTESLTEVLIREGLRRDRPTLFVWEAVLFYVDQDSVLKLWEDVFGFGGETLFCLVDSLKPAVTESFLHKAKAFFEGYGLSLLDHNARWGGAVHYCIAGTKDARVSESLRVERGEMPFSYLASYVDGGRGSERIANPSFEDTWYAVAYDWQIKPGQVYATQLWGEPIVIFRDTDGELVCAKDSCPHRSAPLSMGKMSHGKLECMYHGWSFGKQGACESVPTQIGEMTPGFSRRACLNTYAIEERLGLLYVWRGESPLTADATKLPLLRKGTSTWPCDTVLDYNVDWQYIVENNLDSPHLFWLHDGSVPPVKSLNFVRDKMTQVKLAFFEDDTGVGHYGQTAGGKPKIVRFDAPNIVRHGGTSCFSEEFHIVPIAPGRTRVLLRQNIPKGPILSTLLRIPGSSDLIQSLVRLWNYHIALEDYSVMQGQAHNIDDFGAPHLKVGALGDDLVNLFYKWKAQAVANDGGLPYFATDGWKGATKRKPRTAGEVARQENFAVRDDKSVVRGDVVGTYGTLRSYNQDMPAEKFPPVNYQQYKFLLELDQLFRRSESADGEQRYVL
jgi:methyltransferase (TIGR00027 family)